MCMQEMGNIPIIADRINLVFIFFNFLFIYFFKF